MPSKSDKDAPNGTRPPTLFERTFLSIDRPLRFIAHLTLLGFVGSLIGAIVQYNSWRDEKNLARAQEELKAAESAFSEISTSMTSIMNIQQILVYTDKAFLMSKEKNEQELFHKNMKSAYDAYISARTSLRENIDVLQSKATTYIDRPMDPDRPELSLLELVRQSLEIKLPSHTDELMNARFDCRKNMPNWRSRDVISADLAINWNDTSSHVLTFYYCINRIHYALLSSRIWSSQEPSDEQDNKVQERLARLKQIENDLDLQIDRLRDFMALAGAKIEKMRLRDRPSGFFFINFLGFGSARSQSEMPRSRFSIHSVIRSWFAQYSRPATPLHHKPIVALITRPERYPGAESGSASKIPMSGALDEK